MGGGFSLCFWTGLSSFRRGWDDGYGKCLGVGGIIIGDLWMASYPLLSVVYKGCILVILLITYLLSSW